MCIFSLGVSKVKALHVDVSGNPIVKDWGENFEFPNEGIISIKVDDMNGRYTLMGLVIGTGMELVFY